MHLHSLTKFASIFQFTVKVKMNTAYENKVQEYLLSQRFNRLNRPRVGIYL